MKNLILSLSALCLMGCGAVGTNGKIENKSLTYSTNNVTIDINYPYAVGFPAGEQINSSMDTLLRGFLSENDREADFKMPYDSLFMKIDNYFTGFEIETMKFEMSTTWSGYQNSEIISILTNNFIFSGGAHPNTYIFADNYYAKTGKKFNFTDLLVDQEAFRKTLIDAFISTYDLPTNPTTEQTGLFAEMGELPIPSNVVFTDKGLEVVYNQYEVAPYAFGVITLSIDYEQVALKEGVKINDFTEINAVK